MKIKHKQKYLSAFIANTELHAGGLFFCIIYQNCLEFNANGRVTLTKIIVDAFRPMDDQDVSHIKDYRIEGDYFFNERGYLICEFKDLFLKYTGLQTEKNENIIPFHIYDSRLLNRWSEVYQLKATVQ
jgi:hypothetical protein